ncbi:rCG44760, partial [Rattus norvegicus]
MKWVVTPLLDSNPVVRQALGYTNTVKFLLKTTSGKSYCTSKLSLKNLKGKSSVFCRR